MAHLTLTDVNLDYPMYGVRGNDLRKAVVRRLVGGRVQVDSGIGTVTVRALEDINLDLKPGSQLLLVGHNGAGKSTLLKVLAGVYKPTTGTISSSGRVLSIFDLLNGFVYDASGKDNIVIRAAAMGIGLTEARSKVDEIIAFAELDSYIDMPLYSYSAGMIVRLGFAITTAFEADILLLDEVIGAGDASFQLKAQTRLKNLAKEAAITVLASHALEAGGEFAVSALWLEKGRQRAYGPVEEVLQNMKENHYGA